MMKEIGNDSSWRAATPPVTESESFTLCPELFLAELTPEQYKARQQLYQVAYDRAVAKTSQPKPFVPPFEFEFHDGI